MNQSIRIPREMAVLAAAGVVLAGAMLVGRSATMYHAASIVAQNGQSPMMEAARITATKISEEKLAHVPGKTVTVEIVEFPPGAIAPEHHHAGSVTAYILSGTLRSQLGGGLPADYEAGESFFEPPGAIHVLAENPSLTEPARFMAIHIADDGAQLTVYH
jgi:quercetin dioxygenase-like cupin family protein